MSKRALIVIDVQNEYFPGGAWALPDAPTAMPNIAALVAGARARGERIAFIRHVTPEGSPVFARGSAGAELRPELGVGADDTVIEKSHPSAFQDTTLGDWLRDGGETELDICGFMTQMCCDTTTREAYRNGFKARLFADACAARDLEANGQQVPHQMVHAASLASLARFAQVIHTRDA